MGSCVGYDVSSPEDYLVWYLRYTLLHLSPWRGTNLGMDLRLFISYVRIFLSCHMGLSGCRSNRGHIDFLDVIHMSPKAGTTHYVVG